MTLTTLVDAESVSAGLSCSVVAYHAAVPLVDFTVSCNRTHSVTFWVDDADFTSTATASELTGYRVTGAAATSGTGDTYQLDSGNYPYIACVVTNNDSSLAATVTVVASGIAENASDVIFDVDDARDFDKAQLTSATTYPDADIIAKEAEIREWLTEVCQVDFVPTTHTDEIHDGDGTTDLLLEWPKVTSITSVYTRSDNTWTALTAGELADLYCEETGVVYRDGTVWPKGRQNIKITYVAGHTTVPDLIKRAALMVCVTELPATNVPFAADSYDEGGMSISFGRGDGFNQNWHRIPDVVKAIRLYSINPGGIA